MSELREWWTNIYDDGPGFCQCKTREGAIRVAGTAFLPLYRIHVRLKSEGAPRRYLNADNRAAWEQDPGTCLSLKAAGYAGFLRRGVGFWAGRLPVTAERADQAGEA